MSKRSSKSRILIIIVVILVVAVLVCAGFFLLNKKQTGSQAQAVLAQMEQMVPGLEQIGAEDAGAGAGGSSGLGRDPLAVLSIEGVDVVGCLQIPSLNIMVPVTNQGVEIDSFVTWVSGSPVQGHFRLSGKKSDVFMKLSKIAPGEVVVFTDIDGVTYQYQVTTQLNLKNWDEADYDLILGYDIDSDTQFIVGCTAM